MHFKVCFTLYLRKSCSVNLWAIENCIFDLRSIECKMRFILWTVLQKHNTENSKLIFPEKEFCRLSPIFHIHLSVSDLYIPMIGLPFLLQENMRTDLGLY